MIILLMLPYKTVSLFLTNGALNKRTVCNRHLHSGMLMKTAGVANYNGSQSFSGTDSIYGESINTNRVEMISTLALSKSLTADLSYNYHLQDSYYGRIKYYASQHVGFCTTALEQNLGPA